MLKWFNKVAQILQNKPKLDAELWDELEEALIGGDVSAAVTIRLLDGLEARSKKERWTDAEQLTTAIREEVAKMLADDAPGLAVPAQKPAVYMLVGVNGTGKTTSAAKLAWDLKQQGKTVLLAAADTFRAAAIDQLEVWASRAGVDMVKHQPNADPSAVVYDAIQAAQARGIDVVIADTAGRLHNKANLMQELGKLGRVTQKTLGRAPDETLLVLDATTGQNAVSQAKEFGAATPLTGFILTKMDGTAKGGVVLTLASEMRIPVKFIGMGEKISDLKPFHPLDFADSLFRSDDEIEAAQSEPAAPRTLPQPAEAQFAAPAAAPRPAFEVEPYAEPTGTPEEPFTRFPEFPLPAPEPAALSEPAPAPQTEPAAEEPTVPKPEPSGWRRFFRRGG